MKWIQSLSPSANTTYRIPAEYNTALKVVKSGSGQPWGPINASTASMVLLCVIFLISAVVYLAYRVYHLEKYFSKDYEREHGPSQIPKRDPSE